WNHSVAVAPEIAVRKTEARADRELDVLQDLVRVLPVLEQRPLIGAHDEGRVSEMTVAHGVDGECVRVELDLRVGKRGLRELQTGFCIGDDASMPGLLGDQDDQPVQRYGLERRLGEFDVTVVRRVERTAEETDHESSTTSSPIATSSPFL